jgi:GT2 family glycosyltransferase
MMDLSIVIINYKTKRITGDCLLSIKRSTDKLKKEVIVVDNGSEDGSLTYLRKRFPWVKVLDGGGNIGFARGNNLAVSKAKGKYVWILNSDTLLKKNTIALLMQEVLKTRAEIASCRLLNIDGSIQPQGGFLPTLPRLAAWMWFIDDLPLVDHLLKPYHQDRSSWFKKNQRPGWLAGTALLVKKSLYETMNGLDKQIFMYAEDVDFCLRAQKKEIIPYYFHKPALTHLGQASGSSKAAVLGEYKGLNYIYRKHYQDWSQLVLKFLLKSGALLRWLIFGIILENTAKKEIYGEAFNLA